MTFVIIEKWSYFFQSGGWLLDRSSLGEFLLKFRQTQVIQGTSVKLVGPRTCAHASAHTFTHTRCHWQIAFVYFSTNNTTCDEVGRREKEYDIPFMNDVCISKWDYINWCEIHTINSISLIFNKYNVLPVTFFYFSLKSILCQKALNIYIQE